MSIICYLFVQVINQKEIRTSMVELTYPEKEFIGNALIPVLEEWCQCTLQWTMAWGIREYYKGNILLRHVDKLTTHAISVILQVRSITSITLYYLFGN